jgi:hypothetical protein
MGIVEEKAGHSQSEKTPVAFPLHLRVGAEVFVDGHRSDWI